MISRAAGARVADRLDALLVTRAIEHDDHDVANVDALALGHQADRLAEGPVEVEQVGDLGAAGELLHVDDGPGVEHRAAGRQRDHGERAGHPERAQPGALERVDGDVDLGRRAVADALAVVEHGRLVLLPLADHDDAVHAHALEHHAHRVDRRLVGRLLVAHTGEPSRRERRVLGDAHELEGEVAVGPASCRVGRQGRTLKACREACA